MSTNPAAAGGLLIGTVIFCAAIGLGIGALIGATAPLAVAGAFAGFGLGMWLVYRRYRHL
jgi:hypothetical protein